MAGFINKVVTRVNIFNISIAIYEKEMPFKLIIDISLI
jgi:hypothetical protein